MAPETPVQPRLDDLMNRYLQRRSESLGTGLARFDADEVTPYEAGSVQPVDAAVAWKESNTVRRILGASQDPKVPPCWSALVAGREPVVAFSLSLGNYPQLLRDFHMVLQGIRQLGGFRPTSIRPHHGTEILEWADRQEATGDTEEILLTAGVLRLAGAFDRAESLLASVEGHCVGGSRQAWINERAALLWHRGDHGPARELWSTLESGPVRSFNLGMAELFLENRETAREHLQEAVGQLPEDSAWHHLARFYLDLAG